MSKAELDAELKAWSVVTLENPEAGDPVILRVRETPPPRPEVADFTTAVSIRWSYERSSLFPADDVQQRMAEFEKASDRLTWLNGFAELVLVSTGRGEKEWLFYTSDKGRFMAVLNALLAGHEAFPLQIEFDDDPQWQAWTSVVEPLRKRAADRGVKEG